MSTARKLKFKVGDELTNSGAPHIHCVVKQLLLDQMAYHIEFTNDLDWTLISAQTLEVGYFKSRKFEKEDAKRQEDEANGVKPDRYFDENGFPTAEGLEKYFPINN